jgi:hypothetical protein
MASNTSCGVESTWLAGAALAATKQTATAATLIDRNKQCFPPK